MKEISRKELIKSLPERKLLTRKEYIRKHFNRLINIYLLKKNIINIIKYVKNYNNDTAKLVLLRYLLKNGLYFKNKNFFLKLRFNFISTLKKKSKIEEIAFITIPKKFNYLNLSYYNNTDIIIMHDFSFNVISWIDIIAFSSKLMTLPFSNKKMKMLMQYINLLSLNNDFKTKHILQTYKTESNLLNNRTLFLNCLKKPFDLIYTNKAINASKIIKNLLFSDLEISHVLTVNFKKRSVFVGIFNKQVNKCNLSWSSGLFFPEKLKINYKKWKEFKIQRLNSIRLLKNKVQKKKEIKAKEILSWKHDKKSSQPKLLMFSYLVKFISELCMFNNDIKWLLQIRGWTKNADVLVKMLFGNTNTSDKNIYDILPQFNAIIFKNGPINFKIKRSIKRNLSRKIYDTILQQRKSNLSSKWVMTDLNENYAFYDKLNKETYVTNEEMGNLHARVDFLQNFDDAKNEEIIEISNELSKNANLLNDGEDWFFSEESINNTEIKNAKEKLANFKLSLNILKNKKSLLGKKDAIKYKKLSKHVLSLRNKLAILKHSQNCEKLKNPTGLLLLRSSAARSIFLEVLKKKYKLLNNE